MSNKKKFIIAAKIQEELKCNVQHALKFAEQKDPKLMLQMIKDYRKNNKK